MIARIRPAWAAGIYCAITLLAIVLAVILPGDGMNGIPAVGLTIPWSILIVLLLDIAPDATDAAWRPWTLLAGMAANAAMIYLYVRKQRSMLSE